MLPSPWVLLFIVLFFGASITGAAWKGYSIGVQQEQLKAAKERIRIQSENTEALLESRKRIQDMEKLIETQAEELRKADAETDTDPNSGRVSIGVDGVRRIDRIGR